MKIGVIGTAGGWSSERLADAVEEKTGFRLLIEMDRVRLDLGEGKAWFADQELGSLDGMIIKKIGSRYSPDLLDRLEMLRFLEERGCGIFSRPQRIMGVLDRLSCTVTLRSAGIPMPPTTITEDIEQAMASVEEYGEAVLKPLYTSKARGMVLVRPGPDLKEKLEKYRHMNRIMYIQKKVDLRERDLGVVFLGGEYLVTYGRQKKQGAWNTTTASGGRYQQCMPDHSVIDLAGRAQALFGLDFTCVDVVETGDGPCVFEVSAFGGFRGIMATSSIDPAAMLTDYILKKLRDSHG